MNSKECLERLVKYVNINEADLITKYGYSALNDIETIKQDLDRKEELEEELIELIRKNNSLKAFADNLQFCRQREARKIEELEKENEYLKQANEDYDKGNWNLYKDYQKLKKALEILKSMGIKLEHYPKSKNHPYVLKIKAFGDDLFFDLVNELRYNLLKEVLEND